MSLAYLVITLFLLIATIRFSLDVIKKRSQRKMLRMETFETIGTTWVSEINKHIIDSPCHRNPHKDILEEKFRNEESWVISFPIVRDDDPGDCLELFLVVRFIDSRSQVDTTFLGFFLVECCGPWQMTKSKIPVLEHVTKELQYLDLVFNVDKPESP